MGSGIVEGPIDFDETVGHAKSRDTPLKRHLTPEEVLKWCTNCERLELKLMALVGFFASMRPQETFAVTEGDFIGGEEAATFECSKVMASIGMFDGFVVDVVKQRGVKKDEIGDPKKHSVGIVSVFDESAAIMLVDVIRKLKSNHITAAEAKLEAALRRAQKTKPSREAQAKRTITKHQKELEDAHEGILFTYGNRYYEDVWSEGGIKEMTLKDLRRASGYWLANYTKIKLESLHLHMRHKDIQTTSLYFRRAKENPKKRVLDIIKK